MNIDLYQQLVQWRNKKAAESGKVAYMILSNLTLQMTVESMPTSLEELEKVKGWGPAKIAKYGRDILLLLQGNQDSLNFDPTRTEMVEPAPETKDLGVKAYIETLNSYLSEFGTKTIVGEVIDIHTRNNYAFFTLKDSEDGEFSMSCFLGWMFYDKFFHLLEEGTQIKIKATPKVYKNGRLSVDVNHIEALGEGALKIAFEKLKKELQAQGYFDQNRKTIITQPIQTIGIITSAKSAAIKDFLNNLENQGLKIILKDVYVEGDHAVSSITQALKNFAPYADKLDAIVLTRGGGSLESLKAFNDRQIADTIFTHPVPIICGVGHERDESIADYVADIRCSTPTAIASHINNHNRKFVQKADDAAHALSQYVQGAITSQQHLLWGHYTRLNHTYAQHIQRTKSSFRHISARIYSVFDRISHNIERVFQSFYIKSNVLYQSHERLSQRVSDIAHRLSYHMNLSIEQSKKQLEHLGNTHALLDPTRPLEQGYAILRDMDNNPITSVHNVQSGMHIITNLKDGNIESTINKIQTND